MLPIAILAGGLATRLRPVTETIPKALIEVAGEPFLAHQLRLLRRSGFERVVLCVGYLGEKIQEFAGDGQRFVSPILFVDEHAAKHDFTAALKTDPQYPIEETKEWVWYQYEEAQPVVGNTP
jgi:NDP-sugar pyrophosphorylase family protein